MRRENQSRLSFGNFIFQLPVILNNLIVDLIITVSKWDIFNDINDIFNNSVKYKMW